MRNTLRKYRNHLFFFLSLNCAVTAEAQFVRFRTINTESGLPNNNVNAIVQDSRGFIWLGTADGLARFDGYSFRIYKNNPADSTSLSGEAIRCLYISDDTTLWVGSKDNGLSRMNLKTGKFTQYRNDTTNKKSFPALSVNCIVKRKDKLYIGTSFTGAVVMDLKTETFTWLFEENTGPAKVTVRGIIEDNNDNLWISTTGEGLIRYNPDTKEMKVFKSEGHPGSLSDNRIRTAFLDSRGNLWISTWSYGFHILNIKTGKMVYDKDTSEWLNRENMSYLISEFAEDKQGRILLATAEGGLGVFSYKDSSFRSHLHHDAMPGSIGDNTVLSLFVDRGGKIWAGTWKGGVSILDPDLEKFGLYNHHPADSTTLHQSQVFSMKQIRSGEILIGTSEAIAIYNPKNGKFSRLPYSKEISGSIQHNSVIYTIEEDSEGIIWAASYGGGLYAYDRATKKYRNYIALRQEGHLRSNAPSCLLAHGKYLYVGTNGGGFSVMDRETEYFETYFSDDSTATKVLHDIIHCLYLKNDTSLWLGTDLGISIFNPKTKSFTNYTSDFKDESTLPGPNISSIYEDAEGKMWIGTTGGLCYYKGNGKFVRMAAKNPDLGLEIVSILGDRKNNLWLATEKGIVKYSVYDNSSRLYTPAEGLQGLDFMHGAKLAGTDGRLYFGGLSGFNAFYPEAIVPDEYSPKVVITDFYVLNKPMESVRDISYLDRIELSWSDYFFSVHFSSPSFSDPSLISYSYKLEGFNEEWIDNGKTNHVTFTNLDPGEYVLKIKARNSDGISSEEMSFVIYIEPPFWKTKWFYALCILLVILIVYLYIRYREKKLQSEKAMLERRVDERTFELREEKIKVEEAHKDIRDSIHYARRIQDAILPIESEILNVLPESFVLYLPKDIVSGDFYWFTEQDGLLFIAAADCTGHGVPGAFMSMIGNTLLNEIVKEKKINDPGLILQQLHIGVRLALKQDQQISETRDGMDIALCCLDFSNGKAKIKYAGANRALGMIVENEWREIKADKFPIGGLQGSEGRVFKTHEFELNNEDMLFLFSDGYADQFGGEGTVTEKSSGKKFKVKNLQQLLVQNRSKSMKEQKEALRVNFEKWKGSLEQVDDVLIIAIRIKI